MKEEDKFILVGLALLVAPALLKRVTEAKPTPAPPGTGGPPPDMVREVMAVYPTPGVITFLPTAPPAPPPVTMSQPPPIRPPDVLVQLPTETVVITPPLRSPDVIVWEERAGGPVYAPMPVYEPYEGRKPMVREIDTAVIAW